MRLYTDGEIMPYLLSPYGFLPVCRKRKYEVPSFNCCRCRWNLAITFGLLGILDGHMSGHEMLEMPTEVWPAMLISYLITFLALVIHRSRQIKETIAPQWFILAALLWFPALFLIAHGMVLKSTSSSRHFTKRFYRCGMAKALSGSG